MSDKVFQTYRFEFCNDEKIHSISFEGRITQEDIHGILKALHNRLYENCSEAIRSYLEEYHFFSSSNAMPAASSSSSSVQITYPSTSSVLYHLGIFLSKQSMSRILSSSTASTLYMVP